MAEGQKDWFKVYRSLLSDKIWLSEPFTKGQAWIDLIGRANYGTTEHISGPHCEFYYRGQLPTSIKALAKRWRWSNRKVMNYLSALSEARMVSVKSTANGTIITIENYGIYQNQGTAKASQKHHESTAEASQSAYTKRINKEYTKNTQEGVCADSSNPDFDPAANEDTWHEFLKNIGRDKHDRHSG